jgi:molybdopterin converting factor small subunit
MSVAFMLPGPLRPLAQHRAVVRVPARATLAEALAMLWSECPAVRDRLITEQGEVRPHVNIFVDGESIRDADGLATNVRDGAEIFILPAVSGG